MIPTRALLFSVDTEPDDPAWRGLRGEAARKPTYRNLSALPRLTKLMERTGVKPTLLVTHSVARHGDFAPAIESLLKTGACEIGAHFHPGDTAPYGAWDLPVKDNPLWLTPDILEEKLSSLHEAIRERYGRPKSFRGGAWTLNSAMLKWLIGKEYLVESSVTPGIDWSFKERNNWWRAPVEPYWPNREHPERPCQEAGIWEIPVTVVAPKKIPAWMGYAAGLRSLLTMPMQQLAAPLGPLVRSLNPYRPLWLRPAFYGPEVFADHRPKLNALPCVHLMCHSNELLPGASPYGRNSEQVEAFFVRLEKWIDVLSQMGFTPMTLSEYAEQLTIQHSHTNSVVERLKPQA